MKCSVFIALSVDGYIAREDGNIDWLHTAGKQGVDLGDDADMGFNQFMASVDCMIMGRHCMEVISAMNLTDEQWPYGDTKIYVLSQTLKQLPNNMKNRAELAGEGIETLIARCEQQGYQHAYVDGGKTIQSFLNLKMINQMTLTRIPILLGRGIPLFSMTQSEISLTKTRVKLFENELEQVSYHLEYK